MARDIAGFVVPPQWGDERFKCECGAVFEEGGTAIQHTFAGHETVVERYAGRWHFKTRRVSDLIINRLRERGENVEAFVKRMQTAAETARKRAEDPEGLWVGPGVRN